MIKTIFLLSLLGLADSIYLTIKHFTHSDINCSIFNGCDLVTTSIYSTILGVPVALLGVIFYGLVLTFAVRRSLALLLIISSIGFLISIWFVYTQGFILNAFCFYCLISEGISTTLFILSLILMVKYKKHETNS